MSSGRIIILISDMKTIYRVAFITLFGLLFLAQTPAAEAATSTGGQ